jgi:hypothetical protein
LHFPQISYGFNLLKTHGLQHSLCTLYDFVNLCR